MFAQALAHQRTVRISQTVANIFADMVSFDSTELGLRIQLRLQDLVQGEHFQEPATKVWGEPPVVGEFSKFQFLKKTEKYIILALYHKNLKNSALNYRTLGEKHKLSWKILRNY